MPERRRSRAGFWWRIGGKLAIEGRLARLVYLSLYQMHLFVIHGRLLQRRARNMATNVSSAT